MRDLNQEPSRNELPPADHDQVAMAGQAAGGAEKKCATAYFMENWPSPPKCNDEHQLDDLMRDDLRKWRLQTLLAVQPFGVPSLALGEAYEKMFGVPFSLRDFDCANMMELAEKLSDIVLVQEADKTTPLLHPEYPNDKILHDARLGRDFFKPDLDGGESMASSMAPASSDTDCNDLIHRAWMERDLDFPEDAVLLGEYYDDVCKVALAMVPNSRGLYRAKLISAGSPDAIVIGLQTSNETLTRISGLSAEIAEYFSQTSHPIDAYNVPDQFIALHFPCLLYMATDKAWSRCKVVSRSRKNHNMVYVESIDFGCVYAVNKIFLYLMPRKFLTIPRLTFEIKLAGVKPSNEKWSEKAGARIRCFSMDNYYLDVLLMDMKKQPKVLESSVPKEIQSESEGKPDDAVQGSNTIKDLDSNPVEKHTRFRNRASYSAIIVDRNLEDMDIYLDEILTLETYAEPEPSQARDIARIKADLKTALEKVPRPTNPLGPIFAE